MKGKGKYFYIKERRNQQFKKPYYVAYGNTITAKDVRRMETAPGYGEEYFMKFSSHQEYLDFIQELENSGYTVQDRS